jgi:protein O-GlcNAc transferase
MKINVDQSLRKAQSAARKGEMAEAEQICRDILAVFPSNKRALDALRDLAAPKPGGAYDRGMQAVLALYDQGRLGEAYDHAQLLAGTFPNAADLHNVAGAAAAGIGRWSEALASYDRAVALSPDHGDVHGNRAVALLRLQRFDEALASCDRAIALQPQAAGAHSNRGLVLRQLGRPDEALVSYSDAVRFQPGSADALYNRGNVLLDLGRSLEAIAAYDQAIRIRPEHAAAHSNRGNAYKALGQPYEALKAYDAAIALAPGFAEAHSNRGGVLQGLSRFDEALAACEAAVRLQPGSVQVQYNAGVILQELKRSDDAVARYDAAIAIDPGHADAHANRGTVLHGQRRLDAALASYDQAIRLRPDDAAGHYNRANVLQEQGRIDEAVVAYRRAIALRPDYAEANGQLIYQQARMCAWSDADRAPDLPRPDLARLGISTAAITPFTFIGIEDRPDRQLARARKWVRDHVTTPIVAGPLVAGPVSPHGGSRIRIGYFSADFHNHATMHLIAKLLETHDRNRFEIHAFSYGADRHDAMHARAVAAVDHFHGVSELSDRAIADLARGHAIDIAVDLKGHSQDMRIGIFAHRPAPVQIAYLGYPGSVGADFIDYIVADDIVIPEAGRIHYSEKVISLPHSYQANDDRVMSDRLFTRAELGLPAQGIVFCSFNGSWKIRPAEFAIWMDLLAKVDGSVLWLLRDNVWAEANLRQEAAARGIDPERLVFADKMALPDHLARQRCADLFLDSFHCNAHTTASDALWTGLPLITKLGASFPARVAASLLHAIGLPELVTETPEAYAQLALALATDPARLATVKATLAANRATTPLFDGPTYARHLERAFELAYERHAAGLPPVHMRVPADAEGERAAA